MLLPESQRRNDISCLIQEIPFSENEVMISIAELEVQRKCGKHDEGRQCKNEDHRRGRSGFRGRDEWINKLRQIQERTKLHAKKDRVRIEPLAEKHYKADVPGLVPHDLL